MPNIDLLRFPEHSCGFLRAGRVNGTDMSCPVSVSLSTRELFQASSICSQRHCPWLICCLQGVVIRSCFSVSWVPPQSPAQPSTVPQSPLLLQWISLMLCRAAVLPSLQWSRGRESPHPARNQGSAAPWTHGSLLPLSLAARHSRGPVGWERQQRFWARLTGIQRVQCWGGNITMRVPGLLQSRKCWQTNLHLYPHSLFTSWAFLLENRLCHQSPLGSEWITPF